MKQELMTIGKYSMVLVVTILMAVLAIGYFSSSSVRNLLKAKTNPMESPGESWIPVDAPPKSSGGPPHSGFDKNALNEHTSTPKSNPAKPTAAAVKQNNAEITSRIRDKITANTVSSDVASIAKQKAKAAAASGNVFSDKASLDQVYKTVVAKGGRVGTLATGETILTDFSRASKPQSSSSKVSEVPTRTRTGVMKNDGMKMMEGIAKLGRVLTQASSKTKAGHRTGVGPGK